MGRIESFTTERLLSDRIGMLKSEGLDESRMTVISNYHLGDIGYQYKDVRHRTIDYNPWDKVVAWFSGDNPDDPVMAKLELSYEDKESYRKELEEGHLLLYIDYDEKSLYNYTTPDNNYDYRDRTARPTNLGDAVRKDSSGAEARVRTDEENLELRKENLVVDKENVQTGEVIVNKVRDSEVQEFDVPVDREEVSVERRPIEGEPLFSTYSRDDADDDEGVIRIPITKERIKIIKEKVVTEEVVIRKQVVTDTKHISEVVQREDVDIIEKDEDEQKRR